MLSNKKNGTIYIGMTNDLERRMFEHKNKLIDGFSKNYELFKLIYFEQFQYVNDAIKREKQLKNWNRKWKIELIEKIIEIGMICHPIGNTNRFCVVAQNDKNTQHDTRTHYIHRCYFIRNTFVLEGISREWYLSFF